MYYRFAVRITIMDRETPWIRSVTAFSHRIDCDYSMRAYAYTLPTVGGVKVDTKVVEYLGTIIGDPASRDRDPVIVE